MTYKNGRGPGDDKVASLEEARRRAAQSAKAKQKSARAGTPRSLRDYVIGGIIIAMAIGFIASFFVGAPQVTGEGIQ